MSVNFPASLDDTTSLPTRSTGNTIPATDSNDPKAAIIALEAKVGITSSTPAAGKVLRANGTGSSVWGAVDLTADVTGVLPVANFTTGTPTGSKFVRDDGVLATVGGGGDALVANPLSQFAPTTSLQLKGVLSDETGSGAAVFGTAPTVSLPVIDNVKLGYTTTATAAGTTTLTAADNLNQFFTGSTTQTVVLPVTSTLALGEQYIIHNLSSGVVTVQSSGANSIIAMVANSVAVFTVVSTSGTTAASWDGAYTSWSAVTGTGSNVLSNSPTLVTPALGTPASGVATNLTSLPAANLLIASQAAGDILYASSASVWARLPKGSDTNVLTLASGVPSWAAAASGGQTTVTKIVASSGGDYTTLGAAIAAASAGWTIYVRAGTYTETTITSSLANLTIIGDGSEATVIDLGTTLTTLSGAYVNISGLKFTMSTGGLFLTGDNARFSNNHHKKSGATRSGIKMSGNYSICEGNFFETTAANASDYGFQFCIGVVGHVNVGNQYDIWDNTGPVEVVNFGGSDVTVAGNFFRQAGGTGGSVAIKITASYYVTFTGNLVDLASGGNTMKGIYVGSNYTQIAGNYIHVNSAFAIQDGGLYNVTSGNSIHTTLSTGYGYQPQGSCEYSAVTGNTFAGNSAGASKGIYINGDYDNITVSGNTISGYAIGIHVGSTSAEYTTIVGNNLGTNTTPITNVSETTHIEGNQGVDVTLERRTVRMKNTSGGTLAAGDVVILKSVAAGDEFTTTTTASDNAILGMVTQSILNNAYGIVLVTGKTTVLKADGTTDIAVGDFLTTFTSAGIARKAAAGTLGTTPGDLAFAVALEAYTTNDSAGVLDALLITPRRL